MDVSESQKRAEPGKTTSCHAGTADYKRKIHLDKMSRQDFSRPQYVKPLKKLKKGDVISIKSIDRLGRNYGETLEQWRKITKEIGADIQVIDMPSLNTDFLHKDLTGVFFSDLVLQIHRRCMERKKIIEENCSKM